MTMCQLFRQNRSVNSSHVTSWSFDELTGSRRYHPACKNSKRSPRYIVVTVICGRNTISVVKQHGVS